VAILFAVVGSASGCTTTAVRPSNQTGSRSFNRQTVSAADLSREGQDDMVLVALRRVRPEFFNPRGLAPLSVSIDGGAPVELSILESMRVSTIEDVRLEHGALSVGPRITTTGAVIVGDVLLVRTHHVTPR
jgi:hypothetical protein